MFWLFMDSYKYYYIKKCFWKSKKSEKIEIIICGIHYFITKLKTKIDVIILSRFKKGA